MSDLISAAPLAEPGGDIRPGNADDTAVLIYTSGTTGKPKGAELTHFQLYMNCSVSGQLFGARPDDVTLAVLPFFHVFGLSSVLNVSVRYGGALSIVPRFEPAAVVDALEHDRCSVIAGVPTMLQALAEQDLAGRDLSRLRVAVSGGASLPEDVLARFEAKFGIRVLEGYGLSETASTTSFNRPDDRRALSVGKPIWGVQMRVARRARPAAAARPGQHRRDPDPRAQRDEGLPRQAGGDGDGADAAAGCTPATSATGTRTASTSSSTGPRTWSSAAATTSTRARSRRSCSPTRPSPRPR